MNNGYIYSLLINSTFIMKKNIVSFIVFASIAHMETPFVKSLFVSFRVALAESDHQGPKKGS